MELQLLQHTLCAGTFALCAKLLMNPEINHPVKFLKPEFENRTEPVIVVL
jgi:hypothetical protein